jgi:hypothetical protein
VGLHQIQHVHYYLYSAPLLNLRMEDWQGMLRGPHAL